MTNAETRTYTHEHAVEVDTHLGELYQREQTIRTRIASALDHAHYCAKDEKRGRGRYRAWMLSDDDAIEATAVVAADETARSYDRDSARNTLAKLDALRAELEAVDEAAAPYEADYADHRWARFFLVTSSNGHIHSSMHCSTCHPTTSYAWLPQLSGLDEAAAVADQGPRLCSVCFPSAPVEWTLGEVKPSGCSGTGTYVDSSNPAFGDPSQYAWNRSYRSALCPTCGDRVAVTSTGKIRKHGQS